jgi:uncharacterized protein YyaL (SSP411 family)
MPNQLKNQNSPYLLQHLDNPVDWYPWGDEALERARTEDKPIFLSVGYAACHWCHVMAHESFEDQETAEIMNEHFINVKVDREERPDIDQIYMQAVVAMTGQGGWPMSVFLTPEGKPFFGGTYFPPERRYQMPSFREVLGSVVRVWMEDRDTILESANKITQHLKNTASLDQTIKPYNKQVLHEATTKLAQGYDWENGGWGQAPKFPQPMVIEFLLRQATRGDKFSLEMAEHALKAMGKGGMYDVVGGGFARYSVDNSWLVPHFEKMLYDNAQLALVYLHAYLITKDVFYRRICEETLDFVVREMTHPKGGFYSSLDADSEGVEGKFYVWTLEEIQAAISEPQDAQILLAAYGVTSAGNFEGNTVLQRVLNDDQVSEEFGIPKEFVTEKLSQLHADLLRSRAHRVKPGTDDKVLTAWNGLMLAAFAEAGRYLQRPDYIEVAIRNADFLLTALKDNDLLLRSWRDEQAKHNAYLEDYAALILGLIALYQINPQPRWFREAVSLSNEIVTHFRDPEGGFFDTRDDHEELILRPKDTQDNAFPSGNALTALALLQLSAYNGNGEWRSIAEKMIENMVPNALKYPTAFGQWLTAIDFAVGPVQEVAILGDIESLQFQALEEMFNKTFRPRTVSAFSTYPPNLSSPELLKDRPILNNLPTAYICQDFICRKPVNSPDEMINQLENSTDSSLS